MSLPDLLHVVHRAEFDAGVHRGVVAVAVVGLAGAVWRVGARRMGRRGRPVPLAGLAVAAAAALAMRATIGLPDRVASALVLLAVVGTAVDLLRLPAIVAGVAAAPSAWLLAERGDLVGVAWIRIAVAVTVVVATWLVADFDRRWRDRAFGPALICVSAAGVYAAVPDTEHASALLGAVLLLALLAWPVPLASLGAGGVAATVGLLAWTVGTGGFGRPASVVGGLACLGLLVIEPAARLTSRRSPLGSLTDHRWGIIPVGATHVVLVLVASRLAGVHDQLRTSVAIVVAELVAGIGALAWLARRQPVGSAS